MQKSYGEKTGEPPEYIKIVKSEEKTLVSDEKTGSKAIVPVQADKNHSFEVVEIDGGLITGLPDEKHICDTLIFFIGYQGSGFADYLVD